MANNSAAVLRNKGIAITVYETVQPEEGAPWEVARDEKGNAKTTQVWIRFDGNALADLEEAFGSLKVFQEATGTNPYGTVRRTLSIVLGWDDFHPPRIPGQPEPSAKLCPGCRRAGLAMREGSLGEYSTAIGAAMGLANGLDPTHAMALIKQGAKAQKEAEAERDAALNEILAEDAEKSTSTSAATSSNGSGPVVATTSSGG